MAKKILFVHGTGVRKDGYEASLVVIGKHLEQYAPTVSVVQCLWGQVVGAKLNRDGASIPTYGQSRGVGVSDAEQARALWRVLLQDPSFELGLLVGEQGAQEALPPDQDSPVTQLMETYAKLATSHDLKKKLAALALDAFWPRVLTELEESDGFQSAKWAAVAGTTPHRDVLARAVVASLMNASLEVGGPVLDAATRDELAKSVEKLLGPDARGVFSFVLKPFVGLAENVATWQMRRKRTSLTDASYPAAGDILVYQANGDAIRQFIRDEIDKLPNDDVFVFAHSLGGIASFELLVQGRPANVKGLITFGSQAPFFYEIGALKKLPLDKELPVDFPPWVNFYDLNDPLSYIGSELFKDQVNDYPVESGESFPASHSAYLHSTPFWMQVASFIDKNA